MATTELRLIRRFSVFIDGTTNSAQVAKEVSIIERLSRSLAKYDGDDIEQISIYQNGPGVDYDIPKTDFTEKLKVRYLGMLAGYGTYASSGSQSKLTRNQVP